MEIVKMRIEKWLKKALITVGIFLGFSVYSYADFSIEGHYQGKRIYVQSPESEDGFGFCINKVTVNGEVIPVDMYASAFQIDLSEHDITVGEEVIILFEHDEGCKPKLLNPEVLLPKSTFVLKELGCSPEGKVSWSTTEESGRLNFRIEQYKWNKWIVVGEVTGTGIPELSEYTFNILPHSGENMIRLTQIDNTGQKRVTEAVEFDCNTIKEPSLEVIRGKKIIEFKANGQRTKTKYEIFDTYGNIIKKGYNSIVDFSTLTKGIYHVNYDNKNDRLVVK